MDDLLCKCALSERKSKLPDLSSLRDNVVLITGGGVQMLASVVQWRAGGAKTKGRSQDLLFVLAFLFGFMPLLHLRACEDYGRSRFATSLVSLANVVVWLKPSNYVLFSSRCFKQAGLVTFQNTTVSGKINIEYYVYTTYDM